MELRVCKEKFSWSPLFGCLRGSRGKNEAGQTITISLINTYITRRIVEKMYEDQEYVDHPFLCRLTNAVKKLTESESNKLCHSWFI